MLRSIWIYLAAFLMILCLAFLSYEAETRPAWPTAPKSFPVHANVKAVYGEPVAAQGKTIIPVARISYGYGAGAGTGGVGESSRGEGGGGGGGVRAIPVGVVEISGQHTRFVPITDRKKLIGGAVIGIGIGLWLGWRRRH